uniref:Uncharacterized protein n=1 Tax=Arundo donax TaxID=35708 RepID=A0A0A9A7A0_ARUDO
MKKYELTSCKPSLNDLDQEVEKEHPPIPNPKFCPLHKQFKPKQTQKGIYAIA